MVRLVFRPYTQIRRSICTSESLRTSTRVSPGFILFRHSSPSFGSQRVCSVSAPYTKIQWTGRRCKGPRPPSRLTRQAALHLHYACGCFLPSRLAHMLDSLVRVSRRVSKGHPRHWRGATNERIPRPTPCSRAFPEGYTQPSEKGRETPAPPVAAAPLLRSAKRPSHRGF